jgi:hypothetical protein
MLTLGRADAPRKPVSGQRPTVSRQPTDAVHDGDNTPGDGGREGTDFKLVRLEKLP